MTKVGKVVLRNVAALRKLSTLRKDMFADALKREARTLISSSGERGGLMQAIAPNMLNDGPGQDRKSKARGEAAVARDIRKVYGAERHMFDRIREIAGLKWAQSFWAYYKTGRLEKANDIAQKVTGFRIVPFDDGAEHKRRRNNRGRVRGDRFSLYVANEKWIDSYIVEKQKNVGILGSSLISAGEEFGKLSGVPAYMKRHDNAPKWGRGRIIPNGDKVLAEIAMNTPFGGLSLQKMFDTVLLFRLKRFREQIPYLEAAALKKAGLTKR